MGPQPPEAKTWQVKRIVKDWAEPEENSSGNAVSLKKKKNLKKAAQIFPFLRENLEQQQNLSSEYFQFSVQGIQLRESCPAGRAPGFWERGSAPPKKAWLLCAEGGTTASLMNKNLGLQLCAAVRQLWVHAEDLQMEEGGQKAGPQMLWTWPAATGMQQPPPVGMLTSSTRPR